MTIDELVMQPWTECGPELDSLAGEAFYKLTIAELPGFLVAGSTPYEVISNVRSKLRAFLLDRMVEGRRVRLPVQSRAPATASALHEV